jgi:hypothetical protein
MTTFMARLLFKLTEASVKNLNEYVEQQNELASINKNDKEDDENTPETRSQIEDEFYLRKMQKMVLTRTDMMQFKNNTQLLTDEKLSIAGLVTQLQILAKKHVECMNMISTLAINSLTLRKRAVAIEKECRYNMQFLRKVNRRNALLLLTELVDSSRVKGQDKLSYLHTILPQLQDIDHETRNKVLNL